jgi:hypothetical protein
MPQTLAERYAAALQARGLTETTTKSRKYRCFTSQLPGRYYYIGKAGSLRIGACRSESVPVSGRIKRLLLEGTAHPTATDVFGSLA